MSTGLWSQRTASASTGSIAGMTAPLLITRDQALLDELLRLAAAAGVTPTWRPTVPRCVVAAAPLVLIRPTSPDLARISPMRRPRVYVVAWGGVPDEMFRTAMAVGAESVAQLPRSEAWLTELLTDLGDLDAGVPSEGCWWAWSAGAAGRRDDLRVPHWARSRPAAGEPWSSTRTRSDRGVDRVLGSRTATGSAGTGCATRPVGSALVRCGRRCRARGPRALTWRPGAPGQLRGVRGPRGAVGRPAQARPGRGRPAPHPDPLLDEVAARCDRLLVVVVPTVAGWPRPCAPVPGTATPPGSGWSCGAAAWTTRRSPARPGAGARPDVGPAGPGRSDRPGTRARSARGADRSDEPAEVLDQLLLLHAAAA